MADANPTVGELFKAKAVTDEQVSALVDAVLAGKLDDRPNSLRATCSTSLQP
jgi:hypothetical protein